MAIDANMGYWINTLIFNKLADICPSLSLNGSDRRVYDICIKDFKNYIFYLERNHMRLENIGTQISPLDEIVSVMMGDIGGGPLIQNLESTKEVAEFVDMWVKWWFRKWVQRTKIILNEKEMPKLVKPISLDSCPFTAEEKADLMAALTDKLIQFGEICCTQIIADSLLSKAIESSGKKDWKIEEKINFISRLQRDAREISYTHGALVFIKANSDYYKLREWRDNNANQII
jgi:hypothetical protein